MKKLPMAALARPAPSTSLLALVFLASLAVGCSDDDDDDTIRAYDAAVGAGDSGALDSGALDSGLKDASAPTSDASVPDAAAPDSSAPVDAGGSTPQDAAMDATSSDAASGDAAVDAAADAALDASDAALDATADATSDAAQDTGTSDGSSPDAGNWPPSGCDQSYRLVARNQSGARYQAAAGDNAVSFTLDAPWNNQQVQAIAFRLVLDNGQIVKRLRLERASNGEVLAQFAAHDSEPTVLPADIGIALPNGADSLRLVVRYVNETGAARADASGVDVCVVRQARLRGTLAATTKAFLAPPPLIAAHAANKEVTRVCNVNNVQPVYLLSAGPYAHEYAVWTKFTITKKNGAEIVMHHQAYDFADRSLFYPLEPIGLIEKGDQVTTTCVFTNPSDQDLPAASGDSLEDLCLNLALYYPAGVLDCTPPAP